MAMSVIILTGAEAKERRKIFEHFAVCGRG